MSESSGLESVAPGIVSNPAPERGLFVPEELDTDYNIL
jgi:hypothetical protein